MKCLYNGIGVIYPKEKKYGGLAAPGYVLGIVSLCLQVPAIAILLGFLLVFLITTIFTMGNLFLAKDMFEYTEPFNGYYY